MLEADLGDHSLAVIDKDTTPADAVCIIQKRAFWIPHDLVAKL